MKNKKVSIKDAPYYYIEGKGWKINKTYTHPQYGRVCAAKQWFRTKAEAKANYDAVLADAIEKARRKWEDANFPHKVSTWFQFKQAFAEERLTEVRGSTWNSKDRPMLRKYFDMVFEDKRLDECFSEDTARTLKKAISSAKTHWGDDVPKTDKNRAIALYLKMLDFAYENDYCTDMTAYRHCKAIMKKIRVCDETGCGHKRPPKTLTVGDVNKLLSVIEYGSPDYVITKLMFMAGLRIGELLALYTEDVDLDEMTLSVNHIIAPDHEGLAQRFARAKTAKGIRRIPLTEDMTSLLHFYIKSNGIKRGGFLFPGFEDGRPLDRSAYARRLTRYCKMAEVQPITPHAARHTFSTIAHELGYPSEVIAMVLGHNVTVDVNIYNHLGTIDKGRKMIGEMFSQPVSAA